MPLIVWCLAAFGFAFAIGFGEITLRFREWFRDRGVVGSWTVKLMECPACIGFWIGVLSAAFGVTGVSGFARAEWPAWLLIGFFTCGTNFILGRVTGLIRESE